MNKIKSGAFLNQKGALYMWELAEQSHPDINEIENSFDFELKQMLKKKDLHSLITSLVELDHALEKIETLQLTDEIPSLRNFHKCLSPLLLRALKDSMDAHETAESSLNSIKEAIRICLEDELYR